MGSTVIPTLRYHDAAAAVDWLCSAFGFVRRFVVEGDGGLVEHAQLAYGTGLIMLGNVRTTDYDELVGTVRETGRATAGIYVVVENVDRHASGAVRAGARILQPPFDDHQGRLYSCADREGNVWIFGDYDPWSDTSLDD